MDNIRATKSSSSSKESREGMPLKYGWLIYVALSAQILTFLLANQLGPLATKAVIVASYIVLVPALLYNIKRPGIMLILGGVLLNFSVIAANGGAMPVDPNAYDLELGYVQENDNGFLPWSKGSFIPAEHARLGFLGDVLVLPDPLRVVYSIGDVLIFAGMIAFLVSVTGVFRYIKNLYYRESHARIKHADSN